MMWGYGMKMGLAGVLLFAGGGGHGSPQGPSGPNPVRNPARLLLNERSARGGLSADYREQLEVLGGDLQCGPSAGGALCCWAA